MKTAKNNIMIFSAISVLMLSVSGCEIYHSPEINQGLDEKQDKFLYAEMYDQIGRAHV